MTDDRARAAARPDDAKKKKLNPWVENIESLVVAVVLALIIRVFVLEAFVIPTGSMAASLYGNHYDVTCENCGYKYAFGHKPEEEPDFARILCPNCGRRPSSLPRPSGGDRILVNKVVYRFDRPKRWDPFVFVNPQASSADNPPKTTYIKRLIGLPGDRLEVLRGDILVNGHVQRKPAAAQETLWMPVYDSEYVWRLERPEGKPWRADGKTWRLDGARLVVDAPKDRLVWADYSGRLNTASGVIRDTYSYDHDLAVPSRDSRNGAGLNVVTDLRVACDAAAPASGTLVLALVDDAGEDCAVIDFGEKRLHIEHAGKILVPKTFAEAGLDSAGGRIVFSRVDYRLTLTVGGREVATKDLWTADEYETLRALGIDDRLRGHATSGVRLGARGGAFELKNVRIDRDVFYAPRGPNYYFERLLLPDEYWAMGDNSPESSDSRYWGVVESKYLIGKALVIWWHPLRIRLIH